MAAGLLHPDGGTVRFQGDDLASLGEREATDYRRETLGFIFQGFNLRPGMTALENPAVPLMLGGSTLRKARPEAMEMAKLVGLEKRAEHTPDKLSGGERQRVAIARALVNKPQLIFADEPTGNLDTERGDQILGLLSGLCRERGVAVILVTHDARAAQHTDRIETVRDGKLVEEQVVGESEGSTATETSAFVGT